MMETLSGRFKNPTSAMVARTHETLRPWRLSLLHGAGEVRDLRFGFGLAASRYPETPHDLNFFLRDSKRFPSTIEKK
jgi:hypothetical protein